MRVGVYGSFDELPGALRSLLDAAGAADFFSSVAWFEALLRGTGPEGDRLRIYAAEHDGRPAAVLVLRERRAAGRLRAHMLLSPAQGVNAAVYAPLLDPERGARGLRAIARHIAGERPRIDLLRLDGLDRGAPDTALLVAAFRRAGLIVQRFFNFPSRFEPVRGITLAQYVARREPPRRALIERHLRAAAPPGEMRFAVVSGGPCLATGLVDYALVDLQSGTAPEPYPEFTLDLMRTAAAGGALRLGLLYVEDEPAAAQAWIVAGGRATLWRSRHAERFAGREADVALMVAMLRQLLENEQVAEIAFAREIGDHGGDWLAATRDCVGVLVCNPRTWRGVCAALWHIGGHLGKALARRARPLVPVRIAGR